MSKLFISHSTSDDQFVRALREQLGDRGLAGWVDSRELRGGDPLWDEIKKAIDSAEAFAVVVSPDSLQSEWVGDELVHALAVQAQRGIDKYRVIPLMLNGTKLGVLKRYFPATPLYIEIKGELAGIEAAMHGIMAALGKDLPAEVPESSPARAQPLEELALELSDLRMHEENGVRRPMADARLVYQPAEPGAEEIKSSGSWDFIAPLGPIEADDLRWYLENYAVWPSNIFKDRVKTIEANLIKWGKLLYGAAMPTAHTHNVLTAWENVKKTAGRRFSVHVDQAVKAGATETERLAAKEVATLLLGLPWELLHDAERFLFQGATPTRVRRRLPKTKQMAVPLARPPIRILLVTARPEDDGCSYIDHRASALPLVDTTEALGGLVQIHLLSPATLPALRDELDRAQNAGTPYHVVHFDGHGVYNKAVGLGGLCFEHPEDTKKLTERRHETVYTNDLGPLLTGHRIPLVFLEACQTGMSEKASESVASELLKVGIASVVAMSHSVLVETARRFVQSFYMSLAAGGRVGDAMLAGQRELKDNTFRASIFGVGELRLEDWFVPVLYQEKEDPQLFKATPSPQTQDGIRKGLKGRLGEVPDPPLTGFVGRSRDMLAIERLLRRETYAVIRGQGGEGKTALASELARWMVRSSQVRRAAFVSVERDTNVAAVVNALGRQLVAGFKTITAETMEEGVKQIERVLSEQATLLVVDNMESILLPEFIAAETPAALAEDAREELAKLLALCRRLSGQVSHDAKGTKIVFTSREALPAPFDKAGNLWELVHLSRCDAVQLVERALNESGASGDGREGGSPAMYAAASGGVDEELRENARVAADAQTESIEELVDSVNCNARALTNLAPSIRALGVTKTCESLVKLMEEMERTFPGSREKSVYASVELSLRRMSSANRARVRVLGVFQGCVDLNALSVMMQWEAPDVVSLATELVATGLATPNQYNHLTLNPALCPYLRSRLEGAEHEALMAKWIGAMRGYAGFLDQQQRQDARLAATLTVLDLPNLMALLDHVHRGGDPAATIELATWLYSLLNNLGKPRLLQRVGQVRDAAAQDLGTTWTHAAFVAHVTRAEQSLASGQLQEAFKLAKELLERARAAGESAYQAADYDLAVACFLLARVLNTGRQSHAALEQLRESQERFEAVENRRPGGAAASMASACLTERGDCLADLGKTEEAAAAYEESIQRFEARRDVRGVAIAKLQLGTARLRQRRYADALTAFTEALKTFTDLGEPGTVAIIWHQIGMVHQESGNAEAAERAYQQSLAIKVQQKDVAGQATSLGQLGSFYYSVLKRPGEAVAFYRRAADAFAAIGDTAQEGVARSDVGKVLRHLKRLDEARSETRRAIDCKKPFGHAGTPWAAWSIFANIETDAKNPVAAAEATAEARAAFLAYRRDGGENHDGSGRLAFAVTQAMLAGQGTQVGGQLQQLAADPKHAAGLPFLHALQAILAGSRDPALAADPRLNYQQSAEITILIETLQQAK